MTEAYSWYYQLLKPVWAPPGWLFGPVWIVLYALIAISFGWVFFQILSKKMPALLAVPIILNLLFNFAFAHIQFGWQNNFWAAVDIILVEITLVWVMVAMWPRARWVVYVNLPYLLWVTFATVLQLTITYLNW